MCQPLVPVLLLTAVALSSSNVLPLSKNIFDQKNDNTYNRNRFHTRNIFDRLVCKEIDSIQRENICRLYREYVGIVNKRAAYDFNADVIDKDNKYDGEGFQKEQWHNYPRQLDRLQPYAIERHKMKYYKRILEPDDPDDVREVLRDDFNRDQITANEYHLANNDDNNQVYDSIMASTDPLLILKIRLACVNNEKVNTNTTRIFDILSQLVNGMYSGSFEDENGLMNNFNPEIEVLKFKKDSVDLQGSQEFDDDTQSETAERLPIKKRLFSLWSRLQTLQHKGHEMHHRRHLAALYGFHDKLGGEMPQYGLRDEVGGDNGDMSLTAETRAALMRPRGSPLRWG